MKDLRIYKDCVLRATSAFQGNLYDVEFISGGNVRELANYINIVLGEYNYFTAVNRCWVTMAEAITKGYLYNLRGRPRVMDTDAVLEFVYAKYPELEEGLDLERSERERNNFLESDQLWPFFKVDTVDVNVYRRMTRGNNTPVTYLSKNIRGLHKNKNGHVVGEEEKTRKLLYNAYLSLRELWKRGIVPMLTVNEQREENLSSAMTKLKEKQE